jgi:hypothetical protein
MCYYEQYLKNWRRIVRWILVICPVVFVLCALNLVYFGLVGKVVVPPIISGAILLTAVGLFAVAFVARRDPRY